MLEEHCAEWGCKVIFFPKFHPELNFIEQCWGYAKRVYRMLPESSSEEDLERNMLEALESVPLASMSRFAIRSSRFAVHTFTGQIEEMQLGPTKNIGATELFLLDFRKT
jgi:hypothetical protein